MIPDVRRDPSGREQVSQIAREVIARTILFAGKVAPIIARRQPFRFPLGQPAAVFFQRFYDAFGKDASMKKDWGFSALIEFGGKRILFDTGNNSEIFASNVKAKNVDLTKIISSSFRTATEITWRA